MFTLRNRSGEKVDSGLFIGDALNRLAKARREGEADVLLYEESFHQDQPKFLILEIPEGMEVDCILYNPPDGTNSSRLLFGQTRAIVQPTLGDLAKFTEYDTQYGQSCYSNNYKLYVRLIPAEEADALAKHLMRAEYPERAIIE